MSSPHPVRLACLGVLACTTVLAQAPPRPEQDAASRAHSELQALLDTLDATACLFHRNGRWYSGPEARRHLQAKWSSMNRRVPLSTPEQFIEHVASRSLHSGQPYQVKCGEAAPVASERWLQEQLQQVRSVRRGLAAP